MTILEVATGKRRIVEVKPVEKKDFQKLTSKRYSFPWKQWRDKAAVYKLSLRSTMDIVGVMAISDIPGDQRIEIGLIAVSTENAGANKIFDGIAGCLIAFACQEAARKYGHDACVSLIPKTRLRSHYIAKYGMIDSGGLHLFLEGQSLFNIISKYIP